MNHQGWTCSTLHFSLCIQVILVLRFAPIRNRFTILPRTRYRLRREPSEADYTALHSGTIYRFADWPNSSVPTFGAGVYTIWHIDGRFLYVGMSGRGIAADTKSRNTPHGIYTRLASHASGRRSGDQFCVYVADRLVLPTLSSEAIEMIVSGQHQLDALVRKYIHENLGYRFMVTHDGPSAYAIEANIRSGAWGHRRPLLNPGR
jgi:hypothetical protein